MPTLLVLVIVMYSLNPIHTPNKNPELIPRRGFLPYIHLLFDNTIFLHLKFEMILLVGCGESNLISLLSEIQLIGLSKCIFEENTVFSHSVWRRLQNFGQT